MLYKLLYHQSVNPTLLKGIKWINAVIGTSVELPPSGVFTFNLPNKQKLLLATNQTCFMTKKIYWHGLGSFEYTNIFIDLAKNISRFLDIGANIGFYSLLIAAINKKASVVAFEPAFGPLHYVQWNVMLNEAADRIKVVDIALSNVEGEMEFFEQQNPKYPYLKHNLGGMSGVSPKFDQSSFKSKIVKTTTLDQFINDQKIEGIDLMKIDTE